MRRIAIPKSAAAVFLRLLDGWEWKLGGTFLRLREPTPAFWEEDSYLAVEHLFTRGKAALFSFAGYTRPQNGDRLRDPEYTAWLLDDGTMIPDSVQLDSPPFYLQARTIRDRRELAKGMAAWAKTLRAQTLIRFEVRGAEESTLPWAKTA